MMNDERYVRKGYKIWDTYLDREVQELNYRSQSDYMCEVLNEKESRINTLVKENEQLKKENNDYEKQFRIINEKLDEYIKTADTYRIPISSLKYGDDLGYFNGVHQYMKKLKKDIEGLDMSEKRFKKGINLSCVDTETKKSYWYACNLCGLLNEQQATISALKEENEELRKENKDLNDMEWEKFKKKYHLE